MNAEPNRSLIDTLKEVAEFVPRLLATLAGFTYLIGFLIIQLYLWIYGYVSFELLSIQYLLVGITALLIPAGILLPFLSYAMKYARVSRSPGSWIMLLVVSLGFLLSLLVSPLVTGGQPQFRNSNSIIGVSGFFLLFGPAIWGWLYSRSFPGSPFLHSFVLIMVVSLSIMGLLTYSFSYAFYKHRYVQPFVGGGAPRPVQLVVDSSAVPAFTDAGVEVPASTNLTEVVKLIYVSKDEYLLEPCTAYFEKAIVIRKELIKGMRTGEHCAELSAPEQMPILPLLP